MPDGELVAILGRNGMGKTSLCRSIMSLAPPAVWEGSIRYDDHELTGLAPYEVARAGLGYVPQGRHVFGSLTVAENLTVAARSNGDGARWDIERVSRCSRACASGRPTTRSSSRAASSRCWRSAAR